jgi:hypothetical protein
MSRWIGSRWVFAPGGPSGPGGSDGTTAPRPVRRFLVGPAGRRSLGRPGLIVGAAAVFLLVGGGTAGAYLTTSGSGTAALVVGPRMTVSVGTVTGQYPGADPATLSVVVRNDGAVPFRIGAMDLATDTFPAGCPASVWRLEPPDPLPTVSPSDVVTVPVTVALRADAPNSCQGATVSVSVAVTGVTA